MPIIKRKGGGASRGYKSTTEMILNWGKKPKQVRIKTTNKRNPPKYKVPKTPKSSGYKWGG